MLFCIQKQIEKCMPIQLYNYSNIIQCLNDMRSSYYEPFQGP